MSEHEKQQRAAYQEGRNKQITIRTAIVIVLAIALLLCGVSARKLSQNAYVTYSETGTADYQVYLTSNKFYSGNVMDKTHAYVSSLVNNIEAKFAYAMLADSRKASYSYTYYVDARLEVQDRDSKAAIFDPVYELVAPKTVESTDRELQLQQAVSIDYNKYNALAKEFVDTYGLKDATSSLTVALHVNIVGNCPDVPANQGEYTVSLRIPLNKNVLKIETNSSVPTAEAKVLACNSRSATFMTILTVLLAIATVVCLCALVLFVLKTRDRHIDYARRVKKILSSYKSYVQKIKTPFNTDAYQVLQVTTFEELLEIRDTLQMPILMYENEDQTDTQFLLPAENGLCYAYKVCVAGMYETVG